MIYYNKYHHLYFNALLICIVFLLSFSEVASVQELEEYPILEEASELYKKAQYIKAFNTLKVLLNHGLLKPDEKNKAHILVGRCMEKISMAPEAKYYYKKALSKNADIQTDPEFPLFEDARNEYKALNQAYILYADEDFDKAIETVENLLESNIHQNDRLEPYLLLARIYITKGDKEKAIQYFKNILKIDDTYKMPYIYITDEIREMFLKAKEKQNTKQPSEDFSKSNWILTTILLSTVCVLFFILI